MTKYKELPPESETENYFKIGDLVHIYCASSGGRIGPEKVKHVWKNNIQYYGAYYHFKQCRKLEEVKPRELWVCPQCDMGWVSKGSCCSSRLKKFREVLDD